jgi:SPP1 family predicted phage head-tail adaptor
MISIGKRDRKIQVLMPAVTRGQSGDVITAYVPRFTRPLYAGVAGATGRERMAAGQNVAAWELKVTILYNANISRNDKVEYNGERYDIVGMAEVGRREGLELLVVRTLQ